MTASDEERETIASRNTDVISANKFHRETEMMMVITGKFDQYQSQSIVNRCDKLYN